MKNTDSPPTPNAWRLSRSVLSQSNEMWDFHASWCRFVDRKHDSLSTRNHRHSIYELHCLLSGHASIYFEDGRVEYLNEREFLLIPPRIFHRFVFEEPSTMKLVAGFSVQPYSPAVEEALRSASACKAQIQSLPMQHMLHTLLLKAEQYYSVSPSISLFLLQCIVLECLEIMQPRQNPNQGDTIKNSLDDMRLDDARKYIQANISRPVTGNEVAEHLGISLRHLNRLCNAAFNCSLHQLIQDMRIRHAQTLLEMSPLSLSDIAESMHFSSVYAFIRAFKNATGTTPGKYQKDVSSR